MKFILKAASVSEIGQRQNQEDSIYPLLGNVTDSDRLFILCDGMGGHEGGEVASSTVCASMSEYLNERCDAEGSFRKVDFDHALSVAYDALDARDNGGAKKMGTTMTFLKFHSKGCMVAHIGDSRIYHIRPSASGEDRIRYVSYDHSLINDLVASGQMTPEEAKNSNQKNVITRAMQPGLNPRPKADVYNIEDIRPGDCFYMCTDGMLERMDDMELADILSEPGSVEAKLQEIVSRTAENRDNHTAHLIEVEDVINDQPMPVAHSRSSRNMIFVVSVAVAAVIAGFLIFSGNDSKKPKAAKEPDVSPQEVVSPEPKDPGVVGGHTEEQDSLADDKPVNNKPAYEISEPEKDSPKPPQTPSVGEGGQGPQAEAASTEVNLSTGGDRPDQEGEENLTISFDREKQVLTIGEDEFAFIGTNKLISDKVINVKVFKQIVPGYYADGIEDDYDMFENPIIEEFKKKLNDLCAGSKMTFDTVPVEGTCIGNYAQYKLQLILN